MSKGAGYLVPIESDRPAAIFSIDLSQTGISYVKEHLGHGGGPLALLMAKQIIGQGSSFAALEKGETLERASQFKTGTFMPTVAIRKWYADYMTAQWGPGTRLVFEDAWKKPGDIQKRIPKQPYFFIDETPYYAPQGNDLYEILTAGNRETMTWSFSIFVISPSVPLPQSGAEMGADYAELLAKNTQAVLASAYDHEGYVMWQR